MNKKDEVLERTLDTLVVHKKGGVFYISHGSWAIIKKHFEDKEKSSIQKLVGEIDKLFDRNEFDDEINQISYEKWEELKKKWKK